MHFTHFFATWVALITLALVGCDKTAKFHSTKNLRSSLVFAGVEKLVEIGDRGTFLTWKAASANAVSYVVYVRADMASPEKAEARGVVQRRNSMIADVDRADVPISAWRELGRVPRGVEMFGVGPLLAERSAFAFMVKAMTASGWTEGNTRVLFVDQAPFPLPTINLAVDGESEALIRASGNDVNANWTSVDSERCELHAGDLLVSTELAGTAAIKAVPGAMSVTLACSGPGGQATAEVAVEGRAPEVKLRASATEVVRGQRTTIGWTAAYASSCQLAFGDLILPAGGVEEEGIELVVASELTAAKVTCENPHGETAIDSVMIRAIPPPATAELSIGGKPVGSGESGQHVYAIGDRIEIAWTSADATACVLRQDGKTLSTEKAGKLVVTIAAGSSELGIDCEGENGGISSKDTIVGVPPSVEMSVNGSHDAVVVTRGETLSVAWKAVGTSQCVLMVDGLETPIAAVSQTGGFPVTAHAAHVELGVKCVNPIGDMVQDKVAVTTTRKPLAASLAVDGENGNKAERAAGDSLTLVWSSTDADSCELMFAAQKIGDAKSGSQVVVVGSGSSEVILTCRQDDKVVMRKLALVGLAPTAQLTAEPTRLPRNGKVKLAWQSQHTNACRLSVGPRDLEPVAGLEGTLEAKAEEAKQRYLLTCTNPAGETVVSSADVTTAAPAVSLEVDGKRGVVKLSSTDAKITWAASDATQCKLADEGLSLPATGREVSLAGDLNLAIKTARKLTIECRDAVGNIANAAVDVVPPMTASLTVEGENGTRSERAAGDSLTLVWSSTDADSCELMFAAQKIDDAKSGSQVVVVGSGSSEVILTCRQDDKVVMRKLALVGLAPTAQLTAEPTRLPRNGKVKLAWQSQHTNACRLSVGLRDLEPVAGLEGTLEAKAAEASQRYLLTCTNLAGETVVSSADVTTTVPAVSLEVDGKRGIVELISTEAKITWSASDATQCKLADEGLSLPATGREVSLAGELKLAIKTARTLTIECRDAVGNITSAAVDVVPPMVVPTFDAVKALGLRIDLKWSYAGDAPAGYLLVYREGSDPTWRPVTGRSYKAGDEVDAGVKIAYVGGDRGVVHRSLDATKTYFYRLYAYSSKRVYSAGAAASARPTKLEPVELSRFGGKATKIATSDGAVYAASANNGFFVFDAREDDRLKPIRHYGYGSVTAFAVAGTTLYVGTVERGLIVFDITQPRAPRFVREFPMVGLRMLAVGGDKLFVNAPSNEVVVFNIAGTKQRNPGVLSTIKPPVAAGYSIADLVGNDALVAVSSGQQGIGMLVYDLSDPFEPREAFREGIEFWGEALAIQGDRLFQSGKRAVFQPNWGGYYGIPALRSYSLASGRPVVTGTLDIADASGTPAITAMSLSMAGDDNLILGLGEPGIRLVDVEDPANLRIISTVDTSGSAQDLASDGTKLFIADGAGGARAMQIDAERRLRSTGQGLWPTSVVDVVFSGSTAFVADPLNGVFAVDLTDPTAPQLFVDATDGSLAGHFAARPNRLSLTEDRLLIADKKVGLTVLDVSDPKAPRAIGSYFAKTRNSGIDFAFADLCADKVLIGVHGFGLLALDVALADDELNFSFVDDQALDANGDGYPTNLTIDAAVVHGTQLIVSFHEATGGWNGDPARTSIHNCSADDLAPDATFATTRGSALGILPGDDAKLFVDYEFYDLKTSPPVRTTVALSSTSDWYGRWARPALVTRGRLFSIGYAGGQAAIYEQIVSSDGKSLTIHPNGTWSTSVQGFAFERIRGGSAWIGAIAGDQGLSLVGEFPAFAAAP